MIRYDKKQNLTAVGRTMVAWLWLLIPTSSTITWATETEVKAIETPVQNSIETRREAQKAADAWDTERAQLQSRLEALTSENAALSEQAEELNKQEASLKALNESLTAREREGRRIAEEIMPFLEKTYNEALELVSSDTPFLKNERMQRMERLRKILDDPEVTPAEKYRKMMETLLVEAEYGSTIEVYQEKIPLGGQAILGNIFRLGRIRLYFLSLDNQTAACFNVAENKWDILDARYLPAIAAAVDIGAKRRPAEILNLPVGKLAVGGGGKN